MDHGFVPWYTSPPLTPELQAVKDAADALLLARDVRDIDWYGWVNMDDIDPDYVGYVMWVQRPPYDHDVMNWQYDRPPRRPPTEREQTLMELGHDFFGLMKTSRHCIGQTLLYEPHARPMEIEAVEFDFSEFAALAALIAAADRMRDFVITSVLGEKTKEEGQLRASYRVLEAAGFGVIATDLRKGFRAASTARKARHTAVHGCSTVPARVHRDIIERDRKAFEEQSWGKQARGAHEEMVSGWDQRMEKERAKIAARAQLLCDTYVALIKLGEVCIRAEHHLRKRGAATSD